MKLSYHISLWKTIAMQGSQRKLCIGHLTTSQAIFSHESIGENLFFVLLRQMSDTGNQYSSRSCEIPRKWSWWARGAVPAIIPSPNGSPSWDIFVLLTVHLEQSSGSSRKAMVSGSSGPGERGHTQSRVCYVSFAVCCNVSSSLSSGKNRMYDVIQETVENDFPTFLGKVFAFLANPGLVIPAILLML